MPLWPLGLGLSPGRGHTLWLTVFSTTLRTQARPAIEFVAGKEGLRPFGFRLLGLPELRKRPWSLRGSRGYAPMGAHGWDCCTPYIRCCPFSFPVQPQSTELPATTEERWRRRHLSPGHKAGLLTVLLTCTGCAFQVTPGVEKGVTLKKGRPTQELAGTTPRIGRTFRTPLQSLFNLVYGILVLFGAFMPWRLPLLLCLTTSSCESTVCGVSAQKFTSARRFCLLDGVGRPPRRSRNRYQKLSG